MNDIFTKARELGDMLADSELFKKLEKARENFDNDMEARETLFGYNECHRRVERLISEGGKDQEALKEANAALREAAEKLDKNEIIKELITLEQRFNNMTNQVINIIKATAFGDDACSGDCSGCSGCH